MTNQESSKARVKAPKSPVEWVCELAVLPASIDNGVERYQPEGLVWATPDGRVLGFHVSPPGRALAEIGESFRNTARKPMIGRPHLPQRIRVASEEVASALRSAVGAEVEVIVAPTPETAAVLAALASSFGGAAAGEEEPATHFVPGVTVAAVAALYRAAAHLYRAAPWTRLSEARSTLLVTCKAVGLEDAVVLVIGRPGERVGFIILPSRERLVALDDAAAAPGQRGAEDFPHHSALVYETRDQLLPGLLDEIEEHGFEVAGPAAHPGVLVVTGSSEIRGPNQEEIQVMEVVAAALADYTEALPARGAGRTPHTVAVATTRGHADVTVTPLSRRAPVGRKTAPGRKKIPKA